MRLRYFHVDAFVTDHLRGNPAGVCPLNEWLPKPVMQAVANENNLSETAFLVRRPAGHYELTWFTPEVEIDLCGHATLASAHVLFHELGVSDETIRFETASGALAVSRSGGVLTLDFPSRPAVVTSAPEILVQALGSPPKEVRKSRDFLVVYETEEQVRALEPEIRLLGKLDAVGIIVTAPGRTCDFVSRFFAPGAGVAEDPVTGSAHCTLIPYWAERLGKRELLARQVSARGGELHCELRGERVRIGGCCRTYLRGEIEVAL
jgi:PhzF family phenazine biosynthesis protein